MLRVASASASAVAASPTEPQEQEQQEQPAATTAAHPLHALLAPVLLTSRAAAQKYHTRIPQLFAEESPPEGPEEEFIVYAYEKDKVPEEEHHPPAAAEDGAGAGADDFDTQERIKALWLEKFERREYVVVPPPPSTPTPCVYRAAPLLSSGPRTRPVAHTLSRIRCAPIRAQIQILLHLLLISVPGPPSGDRAPAPAASSTADPAAPAPLLLHHPLPPSLSPKKANAGSRKRKRKDRARPPAREPPLPPLAERLESYMDKLATWQLMQGVDGALGRRAGAEPPRNGLAQRKGGATDKDERDWMQAFCEDVVESACAPAPCVSPELTNPC